MIKELKWTEELASELLFILKLVLTDLCTNMLQHLKFNVSVCQLYSFSFVFTWVGWTFFREKVFNYHNLLLRFSWKHSWMTIKHCWFVSNRSDASWIFCVQCWISLLWVLDSLLCVYWFRKKKNQYIFKFKENMGYKWK